MNSGEVSCAEEVQIMYVDISSRWRITPHPVSELHAATSSQRERYGTGGRGTQVSNFTWITGYGHTQAGNQGQHQQV